MSIGSILANYLPKLESGFTASMSAGSKAYLSQKLRKENMKL